MGSVLTRHASKYRLARLGAAEHDRAARPVAGPIAGPVAVPGAAPGTVP